MINKGVIKKMINESQWCWDKIFKKGETLLINSQSNIDEDLNLSMITGQIALALAGGYETMLSPNHYKVKVLYISTYMNDNEIYSFYGKQSGGEGNFHLYNDNFIMLSVDSEEFPKRKEELRKIIIDMDPDLIVYDNITRLISPRYDFIDIVKDIKEISGLKSKIISNCFHPVLQHKELTSLQQEASAEITLKHISLFEGYSILFLSKYNNYIVEGILRKNDVRKYFFAESMVKYKGTGKDKITVSEIDSNKLPLP